MDYKKNIVKNYEPFIIGLGKDAGYITIECPDCNRRMRVWIDNNLKPKHCCYCGKYLMEDDKHDK